MEFVRRWASVLLVTGVICAPAAPALACDERIPGSCKPAPMTEAAPVAEPLTVDNPATPASRSNRSASPRREPASAASSSSRRQRAAPRFEEYVEEDVAIPMPPVRPGPRGMMGSAPADTPVPSFFVPEDPQQPDDGSAMMAYGAPQAPERAAKPLPDRGASAPSPAFNGRPASRSSPPVPSSPLAQARASAAPPAAPSERPAEIAAASSVPVQIAGEARPPEDADNATLRMVFICLAGLLAVGTVVRLAFG